MLNLTNGEVEMMLSLKGNTFIQESGDTWSSNLDDSDVVVEESRRGGLISSLQKKGLVNVTGGKADPIIRMTRSGLEAFELI